MNIHLAESGGIWNAYFKGGGGVNNEHLLREADSRIKANGKEEEGGSDERSLAGSEFLKGYLNGARENHLFQDCNILQSFYYVDDFTLKEILPNCKRFLLDSGAFTFMVKSKAHDFDSYLAKYIDFINAYDIDLFFELDVDSVVGLPKVEQYRRTIERRTGKQTIPVFHMSRGKDYFIEMCKTHKYVAFGGLLTDGYSNKVIGQCLPWFIDTAHEYGAKIHGLGYTSLSGLEQNHFDSVDSTSWISGNKYGHVYWFDGKTMQKKDRKQGQRMANAKALAIHNFTEWKKFAKYAETHL